MRNVGRAVATGVLFALLLGGCYAMPTPNATFDYQLGGAYAPPTGVQVIGRDREDAPAAGLYNLCYVNGFQGQEHEEQWWLTNHPTLVLRDADGNPVKDLDWNELILDITTPAKRTSLGQVIGGWIQQCAADGFQAVDLDNLDTYSRSGGRIDQDDAVAFMRLLSDIGHEAGLAVGQKNSAEIVDRKVEMGTDFVVAESCARWDECGVYTAAYGDQVYDIEYRRADFDEACAGFPELSVILRDANLKKAGQSGYVYDAC